MWPQLTLMLVVLGFLIVSGVWFVKNIIELIFNGIIIYFLSLRSFAEIRRGKLGIYFLAGIVSLIVMFFAKNFLPLWKFTTFFLLTWAIAEAASLIVKKTK